MGLWATASQRRRRSLSERMARMEKEHAQARLELETALDRLEDDLREEPRIERETVSAGLIDFQRREPWTDPCR